MSYIVIGIATCVFGIFMFFTPTFKSERDLIQLSKKHKIARKRFEKHLSKHKREEENEFAETTNSTDKSNKHSKEDNGAIISNNNNNNNNDDDDDDDVQKSEKDVNIDIPLNNDKNESKNEQNNNDPREQISPKKYWFIVFFCGIFLAFYASVESTYGSYIASYSKLKKFENEVSASYLTSAFWGAFCVGRLLSIPISIWVPPEGFLVGSLVLTVISVIPLVVFPVRIVTWIVSVLFGLFIGPIWATVWNIMGKYVVVTGVAGTILAASSW